MSHVIIDNEKMLFKYLNHMHCVCLIEGPITLRAYCGELAGQEAYPVFRGFESCYVLASVVYGVLKDIPEGFEVRYFAETEECGPMIVSSKNEEVK